MVIFFRQTVSFISRLNFFVVTFLLIAGGPLIAEPKTVLEPYNAKYRISQNSLNTTAERSLKKQGDNKWQLSQQASLWFIHVEEESQFKLVDGKVQPLRYRYENSISSKRDQDIIFDWSKGKVSDKTYRKPWSLPLNPDYTDQLSAQLQLRELLVNAENTSNLSQTIIKNGKLKTYDISLLDEETIDTAVGPLRTVKLLRKREGSSAETIIWLAVDWNYLIVSLQQNEDDDTLSLELLSADIAGRPVRGLAANSTAKTP